MSQLWNSCASWPIRVSGTYPYCVSKDTHATAEQAEAICTKLHTEGFGGNRKVFPLRTWVEPADPKLQYRPLCKACAEMHPPWKIAWEKAVVAVAPEDPLPCWSCRQTSDYKAGGKNRGAIMDCLIDPSRRFPWLPEAAEQLGHWWSGWPGAFCMKCGAGHALEVAIADNWYDPWDEKWDTEEHRLQVTEADKKCPTDL